MKTNKIIAIAAIPITTFFFIKKVSNKDLIPPFLAKS